MSKVIIRCSQDELKLLQIEQIFKLITSLLENKVDPRIIAVILGNIQLFVNKFDENSQYIRTMED